MRVFPCLRSIYCMRIDCFRSKKKHWNRSTPLHSSWMLSTSIVPPSLFCSHTKLKHMDDGIICMSQCIHVILCRTHKLLMKAVSYSWIANQKAWRPQGGNEMSLGVLDAKAVTNGKERCSAASMFIVLLTLQGFYLWQLLGHPQKVRICNSNFSPGSSLWKVYKRNDINWAGTITECWVVMSVLNSLMIWLIWK